MTRELVMRAMHGDEDAFGTLVSRALPRLVGTAGLILGDRDAAQDAAQDALVRAWRDLPGLREPDRFDGWLNRILVRACHDQRRRQHRHPSFVGIDGPSVRAEDPAEGIASRSSIAAALSRLTDDQRLVLVLRYYLDLPLADIATSTGMPVGTVKSRLHRALGAMGAAIAAEARVAEEPSG